MYTNWYNQIGGGNCTLCGSPGTNKSTCPLNPSATNPNAKKHPLAAQLSTTLTTSRKSPRSISKGASPKDEKNKRTVSPVKDSKVSKTSKTPTKTSKKAAVNSVDTEPFLYDAIYDIMLHMEPKDLINACQMDKSLRDYCKNDELFWKTYAQRYADRIIVNKDIWNNDQPVFFEGELIKKDPKLSWRDLYTNAYELGKIRHKYNLKHKPNGYSSEESKLYDQYIQAVKKIGEKGWIDVLRPFINKNYDWMLMSSIYDAGLKNNLTEILDEMLANKGSLSNQWDYMLDDSSPESAKYLQSKGVIFTPSIFRLAAGKGNLELVKYLISQGAKPTQGALELAVQNGRIPVIKYFWRLGLDKHIGANSVWRSINSIRTDPKMEEEYQELLKLYMDNEIWGTGDETIWWALKNDRTDVLEYIYNIGQFARAHRSQYNIYKKTAQDKPKSKAWFLTKKPIFYFDSMSAGDLDYLQSHTSVNLSDNRIKEAANTLTKMGYSTMQAYIALERIVRRSGSIITGDTKSLIDDAIHELKSMEDIEKSSPFYRGDDEE